MSFKEFFKPSKGKIIIFLILMIPVIYSFIGVFIPTCTVEGCIPSAGEKIYSMFSFLDNFSALFLLGAGVISMILEETSLIYFFTDSTAVAILLILGFITPIVIIYVITCAIISFYNKIKK